MNFDDAEFGDGIETLRDRALKFNIRLDRILFRLHQLRDSANKVMGLQRSDQVLLHLALHNASGFALLTKSEV